MTIEKTASKNTSLHSAKKRKFDEFYTQISDVENEMKHYRDHFRGKTVYLNCDDPSFSAFWQHFSLKFDDYGLKRLISTHYSKDGPPSYMQEMNSMAELYDPVIKPLEGDGDFRSPEAVALLKQADIVVTNPMFSLLREYFAQLMEYEKDFIVMANQNAITYKEHFPLFRDNKMWLGVTGGNMAFKVPADHVPPNAQSKRFWIDDTGQKWRSLGNILWFTNLEHDRRFEWLDFHKKYSEEEYVRYENYDAINIDRVTDIPNDYDGVMGVPITFLTKHNPEQFEIVSARKGTDGKDLRFRQEGGTLKEPYYRLLIRFGSNTHHTSERTTDEAEA